MLETGIICQFQKIPLPALESLGGRKRKLILERSLPYNENFKWTNVISSIKLGGEKK